ncbi:MAG: hypothetical protein HY517_04450 [Candidatus Aenigmarchaeota archaeon]|nr:hypothetical protein [Candidatus Aenigmarchaeota archaeon]
MDPEIVAKQRAFEAAYVFAEPYSNYANGCSLQTASFIESLHRGLSLGRLPDDPCLYVFFEKPLPKGFPYPKEFDGILVITKVVGKIRDEEPIYESKESDQVQ